MKQSKSGNPSSSSQRQEPSAHAQFVQRWSWASASERANSRLFLCELCDRLGVSRPDPASEVGYAFEYPVTHHDPDGTTSEGHIDLYKRGCFVLEFKQSNPPNPSLSSSSLRPRRLGWASKRRSGRRCEAPSGGTMPCMYRARGQAERYVRSLPASEPNPPFLLAVYVGDTIEVFADFTQAGRSYVAFPDPDKRNRLPLTIAKDSVSHRWSRHEQA